jgi:hypothetical protein
VSPSLGWLEAKRQIITRVGKDMEKLEFHTVLEEM